jgi:hypothetical protein
MLNQGGALSVENCIVRDNQATSGGGLSNIAEIIDTATLMVDHSQILSNTTNGIGATVLPGLGGAGIFNRAYAVGAQAVLTVNHSLVAGNVAIGLNNYQEAMGGGIAAMAHDCSNCQVNTSVLHSTIRDNQAAIGGGIVSAELDTTSDSSATLFIDSSTISGNTTTGTAFGMGTSGGVGSAGQTTILNSTISGNQALGTDDPVNGKGGGIGIGSNTYGLGTLTLRNSTVTGNYAVAAGGGIHSYEINTTGTQLTFINSIVSGNTATTGANCFNDAGTYTSQGYNLEDGDTCNFDHLTDLVNTDPLLGPLEDNGGPTWTHALQLVSPAIDLIPVGTNGCGSTLTTDQRGISRPQDGDGNGLVLCDIGAFEKTEPIKIYLPIIMRSEE